MTATIIEKKQSLSRSTSLVSIMTFLSRVMGFIRDMVLANFFGAAAGMDAFYVAFRIPNFMRRLFAEGAFSQAFVPILAQYQKTASPQELRQFIARVAGYLSAVLSIITLIGILCAPIIIFIFAPGFAHDGERAALASLMLRFTFPYLMLISLTAMAGAILNTYGYFGIPAFTPVFLNISMIAAVYYLCPQLNIPVLGLALGVLIAGFVQFLFQLPFLYQKGLLVRPVLVRNDEGVKKVLKMMVPALFGVSIAQLNLMIDSIFASFLKVGSVSWLYYTDRLTDFPLGVFGVAVSTVVLPHLSRKHVTQNPKDFSRTLDWSLRLILLLGVPAALGLALYSMPLIASCFAYGKFTGFDLMQTQKSLFTLALGVPAFMMVKVLASGFYATQDIKTPVKIGALAMAINTLLCLVFIWHFEHAGLTLASALAGYVNCALLFVILRRRKIYQPETGWFSFFLQLTAASLGLTAYLLLTRGTVSHWMTHSASGRLGTLFLQIAFSVFIYLGILALTGLRIRHFRGTIQG